MSRRGAALVIVLWAVVVVIPLAGAAMTEMAHGVWASENRVRRLQAAWAAEACLELVLSRGGMPADAADGDSVALGAGLWCTYHLEDPQATLNINRAPRDVLSRYLGSDAVAAALIDWRDPDSISSSGDPEAAWYRDRGRVGPRNAGFRSVSEVRLVRGAEDLPDSLMAGLTVRGAGPEPGDVTAHVTGGTDVSKLRVRLVVELRPAQGRLAIIRRLEEPGP